MKRIEKTIYKLDRVHYSIQDRKIYGEMGFSFCDSDDSRTFSEDSAKNWAFYGIQEDMKEGSAEYNSEDELTMYEILRAEAYLEIEDDEDENDYMDECGLWMWKTNGWTEIGTVVAASKEYADSVGLTADMCENLDYFDKDKTYYA